MTIFSTFFATLADYAATARNPRAAAVGRRFRVPVRVAVRGRPGVGRAAVAAALSAAGVGVTSDTEGADVHVVVIAEVLKPEDDAAVRAASAPTLLVLNKADLAGAGPGGPLPAASRQAADIAATVGLPVVPMIAHLATVSLGEQDIAALRVLVTAPAAMTSVDAFVECDHPLPAETRRRLLDALDRFGLAHAVLAVADGAPPETVAGALHALSGAGDVVEALAAVAAPVRYRRVRAALQELEVLAGHSRDDGLWDFLTSDEVVLAVMGAAVEVVEASGAIVDRGDSPQAHLRRAQHWERCARGPVTALGQRCAADIARGSLRLLGASR
ncbi:hypothetical protein Mycch_0188 [Mycolicibacterium chubuense NBB4]|uniref:Isoniazid-induced protein IniC n=1 Tax=Mycolicibacterium chubuense (strain NBB4) TaxID=710421 RepID=I4BCK7_MYCCN|nr:hypothetical protein [Mycolicibacterium chubuense]AFM15014.1 hypothetical protein Mycch_0188 [Mycolicibacterium chubuense NBB4]